MKKLSTNFETDKYGLHVRLVNETDATFILSLRTDERLGKYLHTTDNDVAKQVEWITNYKQREKEGIDYYFLYTLNGKPIGVNRIYDITSESGTAGSWICKQDTPFEYSVATLLILRDVLFDILELPLDTFDVRKGNTHVQKTHKMMGAKQIGETELDYLYTLTKKDYLSARTELIQMLNLK